MYASRNEFGEQHQLRARVDKGLVKRTLARAQTRRTTTVLVLATNVAYDAALGLIAAFGFGRRNRWVGLEWSDRMDILVATKLVEVKRPSKGGALAGLGQRKPTRNHTLENSSRHPHLDSTGRLGPSLDV
jgi:hypothetical protein